MDAFLNLFQRLDRSTRTNEKVAALEAFYAEAGPGDAAWATYFLCGQRLQAPVKTRALREWVAEVSGYPLWLIEACYDRVGDLAETVSLLLPEKVEASAATDFASARADLQSQDGQRGLGETPVALAGSRAPATLSELIETRVLPLRGLEEAEAAEVVAGTWAQLDKVGRLVYTKLLTGVFRVGVSRGLTLRALASHAGVETSLMEHRLSGTWWPGAEFFQNVLTGEESAEDARRRPYPFMLAHQLDDPPETLGNVGQWAAEWKWDGLRAQLLTRGGDVLLWSRGQELLSASFPEIVQAAGSLDDGLALDGEVVGWRDGFPLPFTALQTRINRQKVTRASLQEAPCAFVAFDCLEAGHADLRERPWRERRERLEQVLVAHTSEALQLNPLVELPEGKGWPALAEARTGSRERGVEGLMLKQCDSVYLAGRVRGPWWKWKIAPYSVDCVLVYAQAGHGRRAGLFTDFTFAVWEGDALVPFAKAYSGLSDAEFARLNRWIQRNTVQRQGPVRAVTAEQVFELHFENIAPSTRHQSGLAVRFPRMHRWRTDKRPAEADSLDRLREIAASRQVNAPAKLEQGVFDF
ncbi:MAG: ATP-dependent DNA ligase [Opitutales bacterium]